MTYRRRHMARPELSPTLDLLLGNRHNPRSLAFQFESLRKHLAKLAGFPRRPQPIDRQSESPAQNGVSARNFAVTGPGTPGNVNRLQYDRLA